MNTYPHREFVRAFDEDMYYDSLKFEYDTVRDLSIW